MRTIKVKRNPSDLIIKARRVFPPLVAEKAHRLLNEGGEGMARKYLAGFLSDGADLDDFLDRIVAGLEAARPQGEECGAYREGPDGTPYTNLAVRLYLYEVPTLARLFTATFPGLVATGLPISDKGDEVGLCLVGHWPERVAERFRWFCLGALGQRRALERATLDVTV